MATVTAINWQDITDEKEKYAAYLCSREWGVMRNAVHDRCGGVCERCKRNAVDAVHHLTYARKYEEALEDLQGICQGCHLFVHGRSEVDPAEEKERREGDIYADDLNAKAIHCPECQSAALKIEYGKCVNEFDGYAAVQSGMKCAQCHCTFKLVILQKPDEAVFSYVKQ